MKRLHLVFALVVAGSGAQLLSQDHHRLHIIPPLGDELDNSHAVHVSTDNVVYGYSTVGRVDRAAQYEVRAYSWSSDSGLNDLGLIGMGARGVAPDGSWVDIDYPVVQSFNDSGEAVGHSLRHLGAFCWSQATGLVHVFSTSTPSSALSINSRGTALFMTYLGGHSSHLWDAERGLRPSGLPPRSRTETYDLVKINNHDVAVGWRGSRPTGVGTYLVDGFYWTEADGPTFFGRPDNYDAFRPYDITDTGLVMGVAQREFQGVDDVFLWSESMGFRRLGDFYELKPMMYSLNDNGCFIGFQPRTQELPSRSYMMHVDSLNFDTMLPVAGRGLSAMSFVAEVDRPGSSIISMNNLGWIAGTSRLICPDAVRATVFEPVSQLEYSELVRGDVNTDTRVNIADAVSILGHLFMGRCVICEQAADINDDHGVNLTDAIYLLTYLFLGGPPPNGDPLACSFEE